jgi:hypothetical protein
MNDANSTLKDCEIMNIASDILHSLVGLGLIDSSLLNLMISQG